MIRSTYRDVTIPRLSVFDFLFGSLSADDLDRVDRKSTRLNSSHCGTSRMPSSA